MGMYQLVRIHVGRNPREFVITRVCDLNPFLGTLLPTRIRMAREPQNTIQPSSSAHGSGIHHFQRFLDIALPHLQMLSTNLREAPTHGIPCHRHSMHRSWIPRCT